MYRTTARERPPYEGSTETKCNICNGTIFSTEQGYATCENADDECNYDVCLACFKGEVPSEFIKGITCGKFHKLEYTTKAKLRGLYKNGTIIACDLCKT